MENVIYWEGPGYYYPGQQKTDDGFWFTIWSYRSDEPKPLAGMGTPEYFESVPKNFFSGVLA